MSADPHAFLTALAVVLCVAAVTTVVFQKLKQPVVLGYMLAGLIVGPHVPIPLVASPEVMRSVSELGVILLMFTLGLEFSIPGLLRVGAGAAITVVVETSVMFWLGFTVAQWFGWSRLEGLFTGAIVAISSTTIIAKTFEEQRVPERGRAIVVRFLVLEDLVAVLLMAILTAVSSGAGLSAGQLAQTAARLGAFLVAIVVLGLLLVPRAFRAVVRLRRPETTLVAAVGICFALALLADRLGYSVALGAFIAGSLVGESGEARLLEPLVRPLRDMFTAIFFVSVGMLIDPALIVRHWGAVLAVSAVVVLGKAFGVSIGTFITGHDIATSVRSGLSMAQIGEFSFIIASLGLALGATGSFLYPVAVAVSVVTTLATPWLIRASGPVASWVDRKLPHPVQTFAALYGAWVESLRSPDRPRDVSATRRVLRMLLLDAAIFAAIVGAAVIFRYPIVDALRTRFGVDAKTGGLVVLVAAGVLCAPFAVGIVRVVRRLGLLLAESALPAADDDRVDLADAPRRALVATLQIGGVLAVGAPLLAITRPFLPAWQGVAVLAVLFVVLVPLFWRSTVNLQGHVRAGAMVIGEVLAAQRRDPSPGADVRERFHRVLPGLGDVVPFTLAPDSPAVGRSLADLDLRGRTGATVLALLREGRGVLVPGAKDRLEAGDVLALTGSHEAVEAATTLLAGRGADAMDAAAL